MRFKIFFFFSYYFTRITCKNSTIYFAIFFFSKIKRRHKKIIFNIIKNPNMYVCVFCRNFIFQLILKKLYEFYRILIKSVQLSPKYLILNSYLTWVKNYRVLNCGSLMQASQNIFSLAYMSQNVTLVDRIVPLSATTNAFLSACLQ